MKKLLLFSLLTIPAFCLAATKISVQNGLWNNPNTWSPVGVPQAGDDTIIVATDVAFIGHNIYFGMSYFEVAVSGQLNGGTGDTLSFGGDVLMINGYTQADVFIVGASDSVVNNAQMEAQDFIQSGILINHSWICAWQQFTTSDDFFNNGDVNCGNWINSGNVSGNGGQFCVAQNFINTDQISGNIDICDATPGGFGDVNMGTISGSVTTCAAGPCQICVVPGFAEYQVQLYITIAPHPVVTSSAVRLHTEPSFINGNVMFTLTDVQGRIIQTIPVAGDQFVFDRNGIESGLYFYSLSNTDTELTTGKLLIQ